MKKILCISLFLISTIFVNSQTVTPRWGLPPQNDNTYRTLTLYNSTVTPTGTLITIAPKSSYYNLITVASTSIIPTFTANVTKAYFGDKVDIVLLANSTASRVVTFSTNITPNALQTFTALSTAATTIALPASKALYWGWIFNGIKYVETYRTLEP